MVAAGDGRWYLAVRMREADSPRGKRGYEVRILTSGDDGVSFAPCHAIRREEVGLPGFERPALVRVPESRAYRLYGCGEVADAMWGLFRFDDVDDPRRVEPGSLRVVLPPETGARKHDLRRGYKDPFVFHDGERWHLFVIGYDKVERTYHFTSPDGDAWTADERNPVLDNAGWHNFFTRPACVLPVAVGYLLIYEGSNSRWYGPAYNIATGLAYTPDLSHIIDLTLDAPLLQSTTPGDYHTWRYSHWLRAGGEIHIYAEAARPNNTNELRRFVIPDNTCAAPAPGALRG